MTTLSVVIFSYNRTGYLAKTIHDFLQNCRFPRERMELIICDDGSHPQHHDSLREIKDLFGVDALLLLPHGGMGTSFNAGLRAARGKYILHLQDDWSLSYDDGFVERSIRILESRPDIAMVRLAMLGNEFTRFGGKATETQVDGMPILELSDDIYVYSDNPHIKKRNFHNEFGYYLENKSCSEVENHMCSRFNAQSSWKIVWLGEYFRHIGQFSTLGRVWPSAAGTPLHFRREQFEDIR